MCTGKDLGTISEICGINKISAVKNSLLIRHILIVEF